MAQYALVKCNINGKDVEKVVDKACKMHHKRRIHGNNG